MRTVALFMLVGIVAQAQEFSAVPPAVSDSLVFQDPLAPFEVKDIAGRTWRNEDLRGKYTLVYLWNTFTARGRDKFTPTAGVLRVLPDMAEVQRAQDEAARSQNVQVLAFCTDYDYTHAPEYLKGKPYNFPVIADWQVVRKLFGGSSGMYLVIDPEGRLSQPFRSWSFARVALEVQRAASR